MIYWKDFVLDDAVGPILVLPQTQAPTQSQAQAQAQAQAQRTQSRRPEARTGCPNTEEGARALIQETRTEHEPARMAGLSDLDSNAQVDRDVNRSSQGTFAKTGKLSAIQPRLARQGGKA